MRRSVLLTLAALGAMVTLIGGASLFAALTDTARTGTNSVESSALAASADIQLANGSFNNGAIDCGTFSEDLVSGLQTVTNFVPGTSTTSSLFCIKNVGSQNVMLSALTDELSDLEVACTGDEAQHGDATCAAGQAGELSPVVWVGYTEYESRASTNGSGANVVLKNNATTPYPLNTVAVGATRCFGVSLTYRPSASIDEQQAAQSDKATWRFKFTAQA